MAKDERFRERFFARLGAPTERGCREWLGAKTTKGYGHLWCFDRYRQATHVALELHDGIPVPPRTAVMHECDNPTCCTGAHLRRGTNAENAADMVAKGRQARGAKHGSVLHPENRARGDKHGARLHPESRPRGDANGSRLHPEALARGEAHGSAKLTEARVREIRAMRSAGLTQREVAIQHGVSPSLVGLIHTRRIWRHVV